MTFKLRERGLSAWMHSPLTGPALPDTVAMEQRVLGWMLRSPQDRAAVFEMIGMDDSYLFTTPRQWVYWHIVALCRQGDFTAADLVTALREDDPQAAAVTVAALVEAAGDDPVDPPAVRQLVNELMLRRLLIARVAILQAHRVAKGLTGDEYALTVCELLDFAVGRDHEQQVPAEVRTESAGWLRLALWDFGPLSP